MMNDSRVIKLLMSSPYPSASWPSHTDCTCLILAHHSLTRLQASKTSDEHGRPKTTPVVCSYVVTFSIPKWLTRSQVLAINPILDDPHILVDAFLKANRADVCRIRICNDLSASCNTHVCVSSNNPPISTKSKIFYWRQKQRPKPNPLLNFSSNQSRRLGLGPTYAVSLSIDKIHCNFLQHSINSTL